jgi:hypothetical protein
MTDEGQPGSAMMSRIFEAAFKREATRLKHAHEAGA